MKQQILIYHANCYDGFGAAWACWLKHGDEDTEYFPQNYKEDPPDVTGRDVIVADFSYPRDVMIEMYEKAKSMVVLDHHKTARENCEGLDFCTFDMDKSGAVLAWEYFHPGVDVPLWLRYVEDRDLWKWELPASREVSLACRSYPMDFDQWVALRSRFDTNEGFNELVAEGTALQRYQNQYIESAKKFCRTAYVSWTDGSTYALPIVNAPYMGISDLLNAICEDHQNGGATPVAIAWFHRQDGKYQYSLRSIGDFDVAAFAKMHGGGGHKNAAGFEADSLLW